MSKLTEAEWNDVLATLPESPETADGWELSLVRRTVERIIAAAEQRGREAGLREAADEAECVEGIGLTRADEIGADEREWFSAHPLRNVDGYQRHRPVVAAWLRTLAETAPEEGP